MSPGALGFILIVLILALTGTLGLALGVIGWVIAAIISIVLALIWWERLTFPLRLRREIRSLRQTIKRRSDLGYDSAEQKEELEFLIKMKDPGYRKEWKRRRELGYDE